VGHDSTLQVLPFSTEQADPALGIGLANAISTRLGGQQLVAIRALGGGREGPQGQPTDTAEAGGTRVLALVLSGEIRTSGAEVTVLARLADDASGAEVWSERFRVRADELLSVEDRFPCLPWFERDPLLEPARRRQEFTELLAYVRSRRESVLTRMD